MFGRLSPKIWACKKSLQNCDQDYCMMFMKSATCTCTRTSLNVFKLNQTSSIVSSLMIRHDFLCMTWKPKTTAVSGIFSVAKAKESKII